MAMAEEGDLVAPNWERHLLDTANSFRHQGELCDINVATECGMVCMAHSCFLAAASDVLKSRILEDMTTGLKCHYIRTDVPGDVLPHVLQFIYTSCFNGVNDITPLVTTALEGLSLDPKDGPLHVLPTLDQFRKKGLFCDMNVVAADNTIYMAHAPVLAAASRVFRRKITEEIQKGLKCLYLKTDLEKSLLVRVLRFMYTGEIENKGDSGMEDVQTALAALEVTTKDEQQPEPQVQVQAEVAQPQEQRGAGQTSDGSDYDDANNDDDPDYTPSGDLDFDLGTMGAEEVVGANYAPYQYTTSAPASQQYSYETVVNAGDYEQSTSYGGSPQKFTTIDTSALFGDPSASPRKFAAQNPFPNMYFGELQGQQISEENWAATYLTETAGQDQTVVYEVASTPAPVPVPTPPEQESLPRSVAPVKRRSGPVQKLKFNIAKPKQPARSQGYYVKKQDFTVTIHNCNICQRTFESRTALDDHITTHATPGKRFYQCDQCGHAMESRPKLLEHKKTVHKPAKFKCKKCKIVLHYEDAFKEHMRKHNSRDKKKKKLAPGEVRVCKVCGKEFAHLENFYNHTRVHKGRKHVCSFCGLAVLTKSTLAIHEKRHTGEYDFKCDFCGKMFVTRSALSGHRRTHTGERPFECAFCPQTFTVGGSRLRHMRRMHAEHGALVTEVN